MDYLNLLSGALWNYDTHRVDDGGVLPFPINVACMPSSTSIGWMSTKGIGTFNVSQRHYPLQHE